MAVNTKTVEEDKVKAKAVDSTLESAIVVRDAHGSTTILSDVVAKIAGIAIREIPGVYALMPFGPGQAISHLATAFRGGESHDMGVRVEVGKVEAAVDARIVTEYGASIPEIARLARANVEQRISVMTGLKVKEVNLIVTDLHFSDEDEPQSTTRVQ